MRITDYFLVIPDLPLAIIVAAVWGASLVAPDHRHRLLLWTTTARIVRAQVKSVRERAYVKRARSLGASDARIIFRHILPQIGPLLIANTVLTIAVAIFDETALTFLGLGDPTAITWGSIIEFAFLRTAISVGRLVGGHPGRTVRGPPDHGLLLVRPGDRGLPEPAAEGLIPVAPRVPPAPGADTGGAVRVSLLEVRDLHVWFDLPGGGQLHAVQGVTLDVDAGERIGLVGESGCGKTTFVLAILGPASALGHRGRRRAVRGREHPVRGEEIVPARRWKDIAMVFQGR